MNFGFGFDDLWKLL